MGGYHCISMIQLSAFFSYQLHLRMFISQRNWPKGHLMTNITTLAHMMRPKLFEFPEEDPEKWSKAQKSNYNDG